MRKCKSELWHFYHTLSELTHPAAVRLSPAMGACRRPGRHDISCHCNVKWADRHPNPQEALVLETIAWISIAAAIASAAWIAQDAIRHPQSMGVMNVVWPVSALYFSVIALWAYYRAGRSKTRRAMSAGAERDPGRPGGNGGEPENRAPTAWQVAVGTGHCGAGCMLADVACDFAIAAGGITLLGSTLWAEYAIDLAAAWSVGIVFQYFAIQPMRHLRTGQALIAAMKADTLSIAAFQVGMYAWMAVAYFLLFPRPHLTAFDPRYWLMMQIAMICGFFTAYPINGWLIRAGLKEAM